VNLCQSINLYINVLIDLIGRRVRFSISLFGSYIMYYTCRTQLVGDNSAKAGDLKTCIDKWLVSGAAAAQSFMVGGVTLMAVSLNY
jgi:hypothetical protein